MQTNVLEYLENTVDRVPDKTAFADEESALSFIQVSEQAKSIGTELSRQGAYREPVVVYMKKCPQTIAASTRDVTMFRSMKRCREDVCN